MQSCKWYEVKPIKSILRIRRIVERFGAPLDGSTTTDRDKTDRKQRRLAEKGDPTYIFTIPRAILPKPSLCDEITVTKSLLRGQFVAVS